MRILETDRINHKYIKERTKKESLRSEEEIDFKAECQRHNFSNKLVCNCSGSVWLWNPEVDIKRVGQENNKIPKDAQKFPKGTLSTYRYLSPIAYTRREQAKKED